MKALTNLDLGNNQLTYPAPPSVIALCNSLGPSNCQGLIPPICTAYKNIVTSMDLQSCIKCPYSTLETVILLIVIGLIMVLALRKFLQLVHQYPGSVGGTVASISIVTSHAQMMSVVSSMDLSWPGEVKKAESVLNAFYLNLPEVVHVQCLVPSYTLGGRFTLFLWIAVFSIFVLLLFAPSCIKCCARCCCEASRDERVDKLYNSLGLMMSLLAITFTKAAMAVDSFVGGDFAAKIIIFSIIFPFLFYIFFKYFREMRAMQGKWNGGMCRCCCPKRCCSFLFCLKPITMSQERLKRRLHYLTKRFTNHAPYWQFIIWGRQISILIVNFSIKNNNSKWILAGIVIIICSLALVLHVRVKPFIHEFQNEVDKWLLICNIIIVFIAVIYSELLKPNVENDTSNVWSWIVTVIILITMFGSLLGAMIYLRLWKKFYNLLQQMWKHDDDVKLISDNNSAEVSEMSEIDLAEIAERDKKSQQKKQELISRGAIQNAPSKNRNSWYEIKREGSARQERNNVTEEVVK